MPLLIEIIEYLSTTPNTKRIQTYGITHNMRNLNVICNHCARIFRRSPYCRLDQVKYIERKMAPLGFGKTCEGKGKNKIK